MGLRGAWYAAVDDPEKRAAAKGVLQWARRRRLTIQDNGLPLLADRRKT